MPKLESVAFDDGYVVVPVGEEAEAVYSVQPEDYGIKNAEISIDYESIAHATDDGTILGHKEGVTDITITIDDKVSDTCKLYVVSKNNSKAIGAWDFGYEVRGEPDNELYHEDENCGLKIYPNHTAELTIDDEVMILTWYDSGDDYQGDSIYNVQGAITGFWVNNSEMLMLCEGAIHTTRHAYIFYK